jgi:hypothetical protein
MIKVLLNLYYIPKTTKRRWKKLNNVVNYNEYTVNPVLRGDLWDKENVAL